MAWGVFLSDWLCIRFVSRLRQKAEEADQLKEIAERAKESAVAQGEQLEQALEQVRKLSLLFDGG